jgi:hypothetical protein
VRWCAAAPSPDDGSTLALRYAGGGEWQLLRACGVQRLCFLDGGSGTCGAAPQCAPPPPLAAPPSPAGCAAGAPLRSQPAASADVSALTRLGGLAVSLVARGVAPAFVCDGVPGRVRRTWRSQLWRAAHCAPRS